jgi:hypothetical protein
MKSEQARLALEKQSPRVIAEATLPQMVRVGLTEFATRDP